MSATRSGARGSEGTADALLDVGRAFKRAIAARRRMRGRETRRPGELSHAQYELLFCLRQRDQVPSHELAVAADLSPASTTEMLEALESAGLVQRARSSSDRRVVLTSLTDRGRELVEERRARFEPRFHAVLSEFSEPELRAAAAVLDRLRDFFDEVADDSG